MAYGPVQGDGILNFQLQETRWRKHRKPFEGSPNDVSITSMTRTVLNTSDENRQLNRRIEWRVL